MNEEQRGEGGGGRTRANYVCSTKDVIKMGSFPHATPTSKKLEKNGSGPKRSNAP